MQAEAEAPSIRVLLVEDDEDDYRLTRELLAEVPGYRVELDWAPSYEAGLSALARRAHDLCLLDYRLGECTGLDLLRRAAAEDFGTPFIVLTGHSAFEVDVEAMRAGAADYLLKDRIDAAALERAIRYTLERKRDREALSNFNQLLERRVQERTAELEQANAALQAEMQRSRLAEEGLKESQERLRLAMTTAQMGYHYRDFETGMAIYSDQLGALCGLPSGSSFANYEQFLNAVHPEDRGRVAETVARAAREDTDYIEELRIIRPDGMVRWLADRGRVYRDEQGQPLYGIGLAWDITARKESEMEREALYAEERRLRERAEAADRAKDDFLALVSHELRTPLNAIVLWLNILETTPEPDAAALARATAFLKRSVDQQRRLIDDLLDTARIASGKLQIKVRALDPAAVAEAALDVVRSAAEARGVEIHTLIDPNAGSITGDAGRLQQVLWNLLSNAIKFTPRGGRVHLHIERVDPHVRIVVSDTGAGIDPELLPFVFDRFRQSDSSSKRRHSGLGLGLA
ncbi:MAG: ATP-binding protein, partial [Gammaproteobacteria bacterium]